MNTNEHNLGIMPGRWFRQNLLESVFDISKEAARKYRSNGLWLEGKHWRIDPANRIVYNRAEIENWLGGQF
ncbi:DNA-binding protein [Stutzerimonas nitrititolerans]|uniref:DNA-binding protein n=1 Tax=Stutzerimonas nitrititolerans TaxID=2482751 RepID=UPI0028A26191|nr:DNA-binding protein [Stutzerimonas nitrititolerans]